MKMIFDSVKEKHKAKVTSEENAQKNRIERLTRLEESQKQGVKAFIHPINARKEKKEIKLLKSEIENYKGKKRNRILVLSVFIVLIVLIIIPIVILSRTPTISNQNNSESSSQSAGSIQEDQNDNEVHSKEDISFEQTESGIAEIETDTQTLTDKLWYDSLIKSYDMVITRSGSSSRHWVYIYIDFDGGVATYVDVYSKKSDNTKNIWGISSMKITGNRENGWKENTLEREYEIKKVDEKEIVVEHNRQGKETNTYYIRNADYGLEMLYEYLSKKEDSFIKRALLPEK